MEPMQVPRYPIEWIPNLVMLENFAKGLDAADFS